MCDLSASRVPCEIRESVDVHSSEELSIFSVNGRKEKYREDCLMHLTECILTGHPVRAILCKPKELRPFHMWLDAEMLPYRAEEEINHFGIRSLLIC
jgi:hypothetical protein